jgi:hypothetical protein
MNPAVEQAVAEALPHTGRCLVRRGGLCDCTANARRNVLLAKLSNQGGLYGYRR